jgi:hypothetical protein
MHAPQQDESEQQPSHLPARPQPPKQLFSKAAAAHMGKAATAQGQQPHNNTDMPATRTPANDILAFREEMGAPLKRKRNASPTEHKAASEAKMTQQQALHLLEAIDPPLAAFPILSLLVPNYLRTTLSGGFQAIPPHTLSRGYVTSTRETAFGGGETLLPHKHTTQMPVTREQPNHIHTTCVP